MQSDNRSIIKEMRSKIRDLHGSKLAEKASDNFCISFGQQNGFLAKAEEILEFQSKQIIEFSEDNEDSKYFNDKSNLETKSKLITNKKIRQIKAENLEAEFLKSTKSIIKELDLNIEKNTNKNQIIEKPRFTQFCWLNKSLLTSADFSALAEVAEDPKLKKVDIPRRLKADNREDLDLVQMFLNKMRTLVRGILPYPKNRPTNPPYSVTGRDIIIAVIDSEVNQNHPAFLNRVFHRENYIDEPWNNPSQHATAIARIAIGNHQDYMGIAPDAQVYNYKVLSDTGVSSADNFQACQAIQQAFVDGADIVNCSWGLGSINDGETIEVKACNEAWELGMTIVKSVGNTTNGSRIRVTSPAQAEGIIVVGATNQNRNRVEDYSCYYSSENLNRPHLVAPVGDRRGTSYAAPYVCGAIALLLEQRPNLSPEEQRQLLLNACIQLQHIPEQEQGAGIISLERLLS